MANLKFANFATSTIADAGGIGSGDLTVNLSSGDGNAKFPSLSAGEYFYCVLVDSSANREIVKVTARSADTLTIVRAQESTSARAFAQGDKIELRMTAGQLDEVLTIANSPTQMWDADADTGMQVEEGSDEDTIRFDVAGTEIMTIDSDGLHIPAHDIDRGRYAADAQANDTYVVTLSPAPTAYAAGMMVTFKANTFNTGACTINVNGLGAKSIKKRVDQALSTGDIRTGQIVILVYDGTNFQLVGDPGEPVGTTIEWETETPPSGYLAKDGSAIVRADYPELFAVIGTTYGSGDGSTTFNLPKDNGLFKRGWDNGEGVDPNAATRTDRGDGTDGDHVGTLQASQNLAHTHNTNVSNQTGAGYGQPAGQIGGTSATRTSSTSGGLEARPINKAVLYCIKY